MRRLWRFLKKLTIFDWFVVLLLFCGMGTVTFHSWNPRWFRKQFTSEAQFRWYTVVMYTPHVWMKQMVSEGDVRRRSNRDVVGKVLSLQKEPYSNIYSYIDDGTVFADEKKADPVLIVKLEVYTKEWRDDPVFYEKHVLKPGNLLRFIHRDYVLSGTILSVKKSDDPTGSRSGE